MGISRKIVRMRSWLKSDIECAFWKGRLMAERKLGNEVPQESALTSLYVISWKSLTIGEGTFGNTNKEKHFADLIFFHWREELAHSTQRNWYHWRLG